MSVTLRMANQFHAALQAALRAGVRITWPSPQVEGRADKMKRGAGERAVLAMAGEFRSKDVAGISMRQASQTMFRLARKGWVRRLSRARAGSKTTWAVTAAGRQHLAKVQGGEQ